MEVRHRHDLGLKVAGDLSLLLLHRNEHGSRESLHKDVHHRCMCWLFSCSFFFSTKTLYNHKRTKLTSKMGVYAKHKALFATLEDYFQVSVIKKEGMSLK